MNSKFIWLSVVAVVISFIGGFLLANALNRSEMDVLRAENGRLKNAQTAGANDDLTEDEIRQRIAEADQNPTNFSFQKSLGLALYRYGVMKQDTGRLEEVARILQRAYELNPKDYEVLVALGNLYFDLGYFKKENDKFQKAREYYDLALKLRPGDVDVRTDLGIAYFLENPPQNVKAIAEFERSLQENPKHQKTLQFLIQALIKEGKKAEAENYLERLKEIDPNTPTLSEMETQMTQADVNNQNR